MKAASRAVIWSPQYEFSIGTHVFPTVKYRLVAELLEAEGLFRREDLVAPRMATWAELARVHTAEYLDKVRSDTLSPDEVLRLELPFSPELGDALRLCSGGTILCAEQALTGGVAVHLGGGFHHAFPGHGEGFCLFNDVAAAARHLLDEGRAARVMVVDLDVHHGNGTAAMFADEPRVFTFSMHEEHNYPFVKPPGDLDVGLATGTGDDAYLDELGRHLPRILRAHEPDAVLYLAGADPYRQDQLGGLGLTLEGLEARDRMVLDACRDAGAAVAVVLAGGYAVNTDDTVRIHATTVRLSLEHD